MSAPTTLVRAAVYERDNHRCAACGSTGSLSFQHRQASGMGGRKSHPTVQEGLTLCLACNQAAEHAGQRIALARGVKVPRWVRDVGEVPVFYAWDGRWWLLRDDGRRTWLAEWEVGYLMAEVYGADEWVRMRGAA